ncbi:MAG: ABC transporter substrate-binding protein [archaeon]|nr:ABC transporter substrate-binding protein [archaeon]
MKKETAVIISIGIIVAGIIISAGYYATKKPVAPVKSELEVIRIGVQPSDHHVAAFLALEKGWFEKATGIEVEHKTFPTGPPEMDAMLRGELDVAYVGAAPPIPKIALGMPAKVVAVVQMEGSAVAATLELYEGYEVKGPAALEGKKIATYPPGSIQHTVLSKWLKEQGLFGKVEVRPQGPKEQIESLKAKAVDAIFGPTPVPYDAEIKGYGKVILASEDLWPKHPCCVLLISERILREYPDIAEKIIAVHLIAQEYALRDENRDEVLECIEKYTGISKEVNEPWPRFILYVTDPSVHEWQESYNIMCKVQYDLGLTKDAKGRAVLVSVGDMVDCTPYRRASDRVSEVKGILGLT